MTTIVLGLIACLLGLITLLSFGLERFATLAFFLSIAILPFPLVVMSPNMPKHTGLANVSPSLMTYLVALCLLAIALIPKWKKNAWLMAYGSCIVVYLTVGLFAVWTGAEQQWAGAVHWLTALMAIVVGYQFGSQLTVNMYRFLLSVVLGLLVLNGALCLLQMAGFAHNLIPGQLLDLGRPAGTFPHPSAIGKFVILTFIVVLPALQSRDSQTRRLAWWFVGLSIPVVALTLARANLAAIVAAIGLWFILERTTWIRNPIRIVLPAVVVIASLPFLSATVSRFYTDPGGGDRGRIYEVGYIQISSNPWAGTGPNYYSEVVGLWDKMTFWGFPLHNSFLYPVAELGMAGGILFMLPVFVIGAIATVDVFGGMKNSSLFSKAYLVAFPGILAIAMTGWGMLASSILCYWFFVMGICAGRITGQELAQTASIVRGSRKLGGSSLRDPLLPQSS